MVKEKFLIDSNIFITPYQNFYPFDIAPSFWNQLKNKLALDEVSVLDVVRDEVIAGDDELSDWLKQIQGMHILSRESSWKLNFTMDASPSMPRRRSV